jgi:5'-deoxynucleotidase YfbR-like HD superfamily hydrolase
MNAIGPNTIETVSGVFVDLLDPKPEMIRETDIAWALSRMPRFAGHTLTAMPYTVGQHSIVVLRLVQRLKDPKETELHYSFREFCKIHFKDVILNPDEITPDVLLHCQLHDGSEAFLLDVPTPLKKLPGMKEVYGQIEHRMMSAIWTKFDLAEPTGLTAALIAWADAYALTVEAYHLMLSRGTQWTRRLPVELMALQQFEAPKSGPEVYADFMAWLDELQHARNSGTFLPA